jgi:hypothetical protein
LTKELRNQFEGKVKTRALEKHKGAAPARQRLE